MMHQMLQLNYLDDETEVIRGIIERRRQRRMPRERRYWVRPWLDVGRRLQFGQFHRLMPELRHEDPASFINYIRIQPQMFDELVSKNNTKSHQERHQLQESHRTRDEDSNCFETSGQW